MVPRWLAATAIATAASAVYVFVVRPRHLRHGASLPEGARVLPGDDLLREAKVQATRAITIDAPVESVWPWIVQIGADRAGFYSYEWLENLFGCRIEGARWIEPAWQHVAPGDYVRADRQGRGGWYVELVEAPHALVLQIGEPGTGTRFSVGRHGLAFTWAFVLEPAAAGRTRLLVRARYAFVRPVVRLPVELLEVVDFVMTERMLRGVRTAAESSAPLVTVADEGTAA